MTNTLDMPEKFKEPVVFTTTDKDKRDELFQALRTTGDAKEKQAVKFSSNEPIPGVVDDAGRQQYRSTWSVSHPA